MYLITERKLLRRVLSQLPGYPSLMMVRAYYHGMLRFFKLLICGFTTVNGKFLVLRVMRPPS